MVEDSEGKKIQFSNLGGGGRGRNCWLYIQKKRKIFQTVGAHTFFLAKLISAFLFLFRFLLRNILQMDSQ